MQKNVVAVAEVSAGMSVQLTPSKRPHDRNTAETNGKGKWHKSSPLSSKNSPLSSFIRVLCPVSIIGIVTGNGDNSIPEICQETGAKFRVEEAVPGCGERVIIISGSDKENEAGSEQGKIDSIDEHDKINEDAKSVLVEDFRIEKDDSSIEKAVLVVFERMIEGKPQMDGGEEDDNKNFSHVMRLIVFSSQVGRLLGKNGCIIKQLSSESGAQIRILPRDKLPLCVSSSEDLVQISGELNAVRKALQSVCQLLLKNSRDQDGQSPHDFGHPISRQDERPLRSRHSILGQGPPFPAAYFHGESGIIPPPNVLTFRLLCPDEKTGGIIGKGGNIIKALQNETGCEIKVLDSVADSEDRIIVISGPSHPDERISAVQHAVLYVQSRIFKSAPESKGKDTTAKMLVSSNHIGCLLGKGGSIIAEMRKSSGAHIRILEKDQIPKCAAENDEVVQINGELEKVQEALMQITARLRSHFLREAFPFMKHGSNPAFRDQMPPFPYMGRREFPPPEMYSNQGPPFAGIRPHVGLRPHDDRPPFMHDFHRREIPPHASERMQSSAPSGPKGTIEGGGATGFPGYAGAPQRMISGYGGGNHPAIITNTTMEVVVPSFVVPAIYGEGGGCLEQIREFSDAKITITDTEPGASETKIIISGTPEETNAATSLIQAFVILETEGTP